MKTPPRPGPKRPTRTPDAERRARERRVLYVGLCISVVVHLVLIVLASRWLQPEVRYVPEAPAVPVAETEPGMRVIALSPAGTPEAPQPSPERPTDRPPQRAPEPVTRAAPAERERADAEDEAPAERRTAAERLAPRVVEPRLWRPMVLLPREPTLAEVQDRIDAAIETLSDSALAETERAARARDWTVEDADGGRWGISPGKLHLGSVTLPLPLFFPMDMEQDARNAYWQELELQLDRAEFLESFDERVKAIRERRERERARANHPSPDGGSGE